MAQLDGEPVFRRGHEAQASVPGQQWCEWRHAALNPQQEQLADTHVQPAGGNTSHMSAQRNRLKTKLLKTTALNNPSTSKSCFIFFKVCVVSVEAVISVNRP
ncbi:hypothetical protein R3I93_010123 [Phoxinus phoxinus]|uniref:Uncharacterized protein n=1 Tax=Phoxinus phoxinus TaxID=58324 RepID=A0AAN9D1M6_9TELE